MINRRTRTRTLALGSFVLVILGIFLFWITTIALPGLESVNSRRVEQSTKIYDRTGEILLYDVSKNTRRTNIPLSEISTYIQKGAIAVEDKDFYTHQGIKITSLVRAVIADITAFGFHQGGSTITQQVVKNILLSNEKRITRKIKEIVLSVKLERSMSKDDILSLYFNEIPYGGNIYGVEEAAEAFFNKDAKNVTLAEAAYLAAIPQAPTFYSPYGKNVDALHNRKNLVLQEMKDAGFISELEYSTAKDEKVVFQEKQSTGIKAPHFVFYVTDYLQKKYGDDVLETGGLRVITTLDYDMQKKGEEIAQQYALKNKETYNAENAAFVAIDPKNGQILAMVGSRNYFDEEINGNFNVTTAHRQPGSTFKPFVYAQAFLKGYTPETIVFDVKTQFAAKCRPDDQTSENGCYSPDNYDGKYRGPITMRDSLAQSINITSVKTLYLAGLDDSLSLARNMGIEDLGEASQYGLTLVLGGGEVTPLEITSAYGTFASGGVKNPPVPILEILDSNSNSLESFRNKSKRVIPENIASLISDVLSDNDARAPSFGQTSALYFSATDVAVKTGTTNDYRDAWIIGYTPDVVLGAWAGNNDNSPMEKKVAGFIVAPMWRAFMDYIITKTESDSFPAVSREYPYSLKPVLRGKWMGGRTTLVDRISGGLATELTPEDSIEDRLSGGVHSILYWVDKSNPRGDYPSRPQADSQFENWEYAVRKWATVNGVQDVAAVIPTVKDNVHTSDKALSLSLLSPQGNISVKRGESLPVSLKAVSGFSLIRMNISLNGILISTGPFNTNLVINIPANTQGSSANIKIDVVDQGLQRAEVVFSVPITE